MLRLCLCVAAVCVGSSTGYEYSRTRAPITDAPITNLPDFYAEPIKPSDHLLKLRFEARECEFTTLLGTLAELQTRLFDRFAEFNVASKQKISLTGFLTTQRQGLPYFSYDVTIAFDTLTDAANAKVSADQLVTQRQNLVFQRKEAPSLTDLVEGMNLLNEINSAIMELPLHSVIASYEDYYVLHTVVSSGALRALEAQHIQRVSMYVNGVETPFTTLLDEQEIPPEFPFDGFNCSEPEIESLRQLSARVLQNKIVGRCLALDAQDRDCDDCYAALEFIASLNPPHCYNRRSWEPFLYGQTFAERIRLSYAFDQQYYEDECLNRRLVETTLATQEYDGIVIDCDTATLAYSEGQLTDEDHQAACSDASSLMPSMLVLLFVLKYV